MKRLSHINIDVRNVFRKHVISLGNNSFWAPRDKLRSIQNQQVHHRAKPTERHLEKDGFQRKHCTECLTCFEIHQILTGIKPWFGCNAKKKPWSWMKSHKGQPRSCCANQMLNQAKLQYRNPMYQIFKESFRRNSHPRQLWVGVTIMPKVARNVFAKLGNWLALLTLFQEYIGGNGALKQDDENWSWKTPGQLPCWICWEVLYATFMLTRLYFYKTWKIPGAFLGKLCSITMQLPLSQLTSRDRPKSAPYPRLKNSKKTSKCQVFFYRSRKSKIFRKFFFEKITY